MKKLYLSLLLLLCFLPGHLLAACVVSSIALNDSESDSWDSNCTSTHNDGAYAQYYTFTLSSTEEVTISLSSSVDPWLFLLSGSGQNGSVIDDNDDIGSGDTNSRITGTLEAGTYTIEATTYGEAVTGSFVLSINITTSSTDACDKYLAANIDASDSWDTDCASVHRPGRYAKYYTFTLLTAQQVVIDLESTKDSYVFLLDNAGRTGAVVEEDNDDGSGTNARITRSLAAGAYTIEATTNAAATTGNFTVSVTVAITPPPSACEYLIDTDVDVAGNWIPDCPSTHREGRYAKYYVFTLSDTQEVTIDLKSSKDAYMYLLQGSGQTGKVLSQNDDGGEGDNPQISMILSKGTYTVEATTYASSNTGSFVISVTTADSGCTDCPFQINAGLNDTWFNSATNGQGFNFTVYPVRKEIFVTWFTYDTERPPGDVTAMLGEPGHRWLTAQGTYDDDTATLTIYVTEGGVFDSANPVTSTDPDGDGTMIIEFYGCNDALVTYDITSLDLSDEIPVERIVLDNVPLCEMLAEP